MSSKPGFVMPILLLTERQGDTEQQASAIGCEKSTFALAGGRLTRTLNFAPQSS
jgi:hypothetical protein